jgi:hypothetical protein
MHEAIGHFAIIGQQHTQAIAFAIQDGRPEKTSFRFLPDSTTV